MVDKNVFTRFDQEIIKKYRDFWSKNRSKSIETVDKIF